MFSITRQSDDELEGIGQGCYLSTAARRRAENVAAAENAVLVQPRGSVVEGRHMNTDHGSIPGHGT